MQYVRQWPDITILLLLHVLGIKAVKWSPTTLITTIYQVYLLVFYLGPRGCLDHVPDIFLTTQWIVF